jgi:hypothetical protein
MEAGGLLGVSSDDEGETGKSAIVLNLAPLRPVFFRPPLVARDLDLGLGVAGGAKGAVVVLLLLEPLFVCDLT